MYRQTHQIRIPSYRDSDLPASLISNARHGPHLPFSFTITTPPLSSAIHALVSTRLMQASILCARLGLHANGKAWSAISLFVFSALLLVLVLFIVKLKKEMTTPALPASISEDHCSGERAMTEDSASPLAADHWLSRANHLLPSALETAKSATGFPTRWNSVITKLSRIPSALSDLSSHPCFTKNTVCAELLRSACDTLSEVTDLANHCSSKPGKLQMQSNLDSLSCKLDLILRDCSLLVKTGVLATAADEDVSELLARLHIGDTESKHRAIDGLLHAMKDDEKSVTTVLGRSDVAALSQLLTGTIPTTTKIREKAAMIVCLIVESGTSPDLLVSEGLIPPLIRLAESGVTPSTREKAVVSLQRLSISADTARSIVTHGGVPPLVEISRSGDTSCQVAAAGALRNLSAVPDQRQILVDNAVVKTMINLIDGSGVVISSKEYAAECLQNLTAGSESLKRAVITAGGVRCLLAHLDGSVPQESAVAALRNLVGSVPSTSLISMELLPRLVHVLKQGSPGAQQAAAAIISRIAISLEMKSLIGESGCLGLLVRMLEGKGSGGREAAAQAVAVLVNGCAENAREVRRDEKSVPNMVQLLDSGEKNTAKKYAVASLVALSTSKRCRRLMVAYGAVGYLKKLAEMEVPGAKKLMERIERGRLRRLFSKR